MFLMMWRRPHRKGKNFLWNHCLSLDRYVDLKPTLQIKGLWTDLAFKQVKAGLFNTSKIKIKSYKCADFSQFQWILYISIKESDILLYYYLNKQIQAAEVKEIHVRQTDDLKNGLLGYLFPSFTDLTPEK